jgi:hypothetical protein
MCFETEAQEDKNICKEYEIVIKDDGSMNIIPTGFTRRLDDLGRIVIPKEVRRKMFEIDRYGCYGQGAAFEIFLVEDGVYLKRREDLDDEH